MRNASDILDKHECTGGTGEDWSPTMESLTPEGRKRLREMVQRHLASPVRAEPKPAKQEPRAANIT